MILFIAAACWLTILLAVTFATRSRPADRREHQIDLLAVGGIFAATLGFFWRLVFSADVWMPAGGGDLAGFLYPTYRFAAEWWRRGVIPLWNPQLFGGQPFVGDIQSGLFYPLNLITFFTLNPLTYRDMELLSVAHFAVAGIGMYALLRWGRLGSGQDSNSKNLSRTACLAGALAFEYSDLFITHFGNLNLIASAAWLPPVFLFFMRSTNHVQEDPPNRSLFWRIFPASAASGVFLAVSFLAGHIQSFLFVLLALALFTVYRSAMARSSWLRIVSVFGVTVAIGLGLSGITLLPSVEMARASIRSSFTYEDAAQFSLPPAELVGLLVPGFFGRGPQAAWGPWQRVEVGYLGVLPLFLASLSLVLRRNSRTSFFALLAIVGLVLALGGYSILHGWLYAFVPGFGQLRAPARFILLLDFALAVLAAVGLDALVSQLEPAPKATLHKIAAYAPWVFLVVTAASGGIALAILILGQGQDPVLYSRIANAANSLAFFVLLSGLSLALLVMRDREMLRPKLVSVCAVALIFFDLFSLGAYVDIGLSDPSAAYNREDVVSFLQSQPGAFRIDSRTDAQGTWLPDTALLYDLADVNGDNPLVLADFDHFWEALGGRANRMYDLMNIKYVLARRSTPLDAKFRRVFDGQSGISIYEDTNAQPRAWVVYSSQLSDEPAGTFDRLKSPDFDPGGTVILQGPGAKSLQGTGLPASEARVTGYGPNEIDVTAIATQEGYLVVSEVYYPGWTARLDGIPAQVYRADALFRAIYLPPGQHQVSLVYDPVSFKLGMAISALTFLVVIGSGVNLLRQKPLNPRI